ncbi:MAG: glycoside hydrolase family 127 protein [Planctomycetales bacterium]|nr:glycoside hydrolase family 127 protein [Planctomycetales bacterium]
MIKSLALKPLLLLLAGLPLCTAASTVAAPTPPLFNREPLAAKPYAELPLGAVQPRGWLQDELQRMAHGMTGRLDEWYPEVCGPRNAWLGGDGDTWERGPYWIDGLYPLARLLKDEHLEAKAMQWVNACIDRQRADGYFGPVEIADKDRTQAPPAGAQIEEPDDWWPRMVMLKVLQQHIQATGDPRAVDCLRKYFRYQLRTLPTAPLHDPRNPASGSWWAAQRGGDNLHVVLWFYNLTGEKWLLDLADIIHEQTVPVTEWFLPGPENRVRHIADASRDALHCVNLAQMMKTPTVRWQQDRDARRLLATEAAFADIREFHGQPHGLYGGDEPMHGRVTTRGSELCSAVEMMYSLETMLEITGSVLHADRLERVAFNVLPTQCTDDYRARQYFQQANQVQITAGDHNFFNDEGERLVYGLLNGYPCCTCNLHQGWPKFAQHLWYASADGGLAALAYAPSSVTWSFAGGRTVTLTQGGGYPFREQVVIEVETDGDVAFPLHLRIPAWCRKPQLSVNGEHVDAALEPGAVTLLRRTWRDGDRVVLSLPMPLQTSEWRHHSVAVERGPLVFALDVPSELHEVERPRPEGVPDDAMHRGYLEYVPKGPWNFGLPQEVAQQIADHTQAVVADEIPLNPWNSQSAPVSLEVTGVSLPDWRVSFNSAADLPLSPIEASSQAQVRSLRLIPYGATTLRVSAFPTVSGLAVPVRSDGATLTASHVFSGDRLGAVLDGDYSAAPRHTFWPRRGGAEWLQIEYDNPRHVSETNLFWFDDSGHGECRVPAAWRLFYRQGDDWKPVETQDAYSTKKDQGNRVRFKPIETTAIRLRVEQQDGYSSGVLEWETR